MLAPQSKVSPNYRELGLVLVVGVLQPLTELVFGSQAATYYNAFAVTLIALYVVYRLIKFPAIRQAWGFRIDNLRTVTPLYLVCTLVASLALYGYGLYTGRAPLPASFWYVLSLYPLWGIAQQCALQNFVARNLTSFFPNLIHRAIWTASLFSLAHAPSAELMTVTLAAGFLFTVLYHYAPNIWAIGISHGIVGSLAFYIVLSQDQWPILEGYLRALWGGGV